jgi:protein-disulfide isomerase
MSNGTGKKIALLAVFLAMMIGLGVWITKFNPESNTQNSALRKPQPAPKLDPVKLAAEWPQIVAHAAAPARGRASTRYTIVEFGDFQCPQCGKVRPLLEGLLQKYPSEVNLLFIHRPFPQLHQWAIPAGKASEIAAAQGMFWPMYDKLYSHQDNLEPGYYGEYAAQIGMNKEGFQKAFDTGVGEDKVAAATELSDAVGVQETPTLLLRDNRNNKVRIYLGIDGTKNADGSLQYPGVKELAAKPPWSMAATASLLPLPR